MESTIDETMNNLKISKANFIAARTDCITDYYTFGPPLGSGSFGTVRKAIHKLTGQPRAIKILKKDEQDEKKLELEVDILSKISHPNAMQIYEYYQDAKYFYIVSEFCAGGELFDKITKKGKFNEREAANILKQMLSTVLYCHSNNIVHRDLKPENILLDDKSDDTVIKIIDWGGARYFIHGKKMTTVSGTPYYIAPEVLKEKYDEKCDIWSCGVILYILLSGYPPFNGINDMEIMKAVKKGRYNFPREEWDYISKEAKNLVQNMLKYTPSERYSAKQCLEHPWFKRKSSEFPLQLSANVLKNMCEFKKNQQIQKATYTFIVSQLISKEEKKELTLQFALMDKNKDGVLSRAEIYECYKNLYGVVKANEEVSVDCDGNGTIDLNEFLVASFNKSKLNTKKNLEVAFKSLDLDGSGTISIGELKCLFEQAGALDDSLFNEFMKQIDENNDGEISLQEFYDYFLNK